MKEKGQNIPKLKTFAVKLEGVLPNGEKITPETLTIDKFALLFEKFRKLISAAIDDTEEKSPINFKYEEGSAIFVSDIPISSHKIIQEEIREIEAGHPLNTNASEISRILLDFKKISQDIGQKAEITLGDGKRPYIKIDAKTEFKQLKETIVGSEKIFYGKLIAVGGKEPNIHLSKEGGNLVIDVTEIEARELGQDLYMEIGIKAFFKQNLLSGQIEFAKYLSKIPYNRVLDEEKLKRDRQKGKEAWKNIDAVDWEKTERS